MVKKILLSTVGVGLLGLFFFGRDAASYVGTSLGWVKDSVKNAVPIEFEIQRARGMLKDLVPEIRTNMHLIAKEEVEAEKLRKQIADNTTRLEKDRTELMRLKTDVATGRETFEYAGRKYELKQVKADLANRFERYKTNDATLASLKEMHQARERSLDAARQKLENMLAVKRQLEVETEHLDARLKMVEAAQTTSSYNFDDSQLSRAKELVTDLKTRLDVAEKLVHSETYFRDQIPLETPAADNIVDEVTEYFTPSNNQVAKATE
jgi:chromosome segregation ATPase